MIAVIVVRDGVLPAGFDETICEAGRHTLLVGSDPTGAMDDVARVSLVTWTFEMDPARSSAGDLAQATSLCLSRIGETHPTRIVILPASPDGRDLAPRLAVSLERPLHAGALGVTEESVTVTRLGGLHLADIQTDGAFVTTLQIGNRGAELREPHTEHVVVDLTGTVTWDAVPERQAIRVMEVQPPDASTMDLAEAPRILGGGAGLDDAQAFERLQRVATGLDASMGVTRVITDRGWAGHERQIGTTGVVVDPELYISFGVSGAVQHTSGLGHPNHIISVNTDAHCPMMQISDVAIVSDANAVLVELEAQLAAELGRHLDESVST